MASRFKSKVATENYDTIILVKEGNQRYKMISKFSDIKTTIMKKRLWKLGGVFFRTPTVRISVKWLISVQIN